MIPAVVLAAGLSSRMGRLKAILPVDPASPSGETFLTRVVRTFYEAGVEDVVVVVGHEADRLVDNMTAHDLSPRFVLNTEYQSGQLSSVLAGLRAIDRPEVTAMLLTLVDVPNVSAETVRRVIERYRATGAAIVRPVAADAHGVKGARHGHPVLVDRQLFDAFRRADPSAGIKPIVRAHVSVEGDVEVNDEGAFVDVDTPEDYRRLVEQPRAGPA